MDSLQWLAQVTNNAAPTGAARVAGVQPSTMSRQMDKGSLSPETVVAIARAYGAPVLPGLVACGLITPEEANTVAPLGKLLSEATDEDLLRELLTRVERSGGVGNPFTEPLDNLDDNEPANVHHLFAECDDEQEPTEQDYLQMAALDPGYPPDAENEQ